MCVVTDKIKFCTCLSSSTDKLKHYWILHRYNKTKNEMIMGMPIFPSKFTLNYEENKTTLFNRINETDAFDFETDFKEKDQLEICLNNIFIDYSERATYCFKFKKGKWVLTEFDSFNLMSRFDEFQFGKLKGIKK